MTELGRGLRGPVAVSAGELMGTGDGRLGVDLFRDGPDAGITDPLADYQPDPPTDAERDEPGMELSESAVLLDDAAASGIRPGYVYGPSGIYMYKTVQGKLQRRQLSNWTARIVAVTTRDDGSMSLSRSAVIEAKFRGQVTTFEVTPKELPNVQNWVLEGLSMTARCFSGERDVQRQLLNAIQEASPRPEQRTVFTSTGWRTVDSQRVYVHGGGAIGADGARADIRVELPQNLAAQHLPEPPAGQQEVLAVKACLSLLELAPDRVLAPVLGAVWRAPLGESRLTVWVTGRTGAGKSELTALAQQHFGAGFDAHHLPAAWASTANSINELAYFAKDMILTVDDFVPKGDRRAVADLHRTAEDVIRAQGNGAGRGRLDADSAIRRTRPPRGTLLSSGEDVPHGQSLRARMLIVDLGPGDLDFTRLSAAQQHARDGVLACGMAGLVRWLAANPARLDAAAGDVRTLRATLEGAGGHRRTPAVLAEAALGWRTLLDYAQSVEALTAADSEALWQRVLAALGQVGEQQGDQDADAEPTARFLDLLSSAISSGLAHLASTAGTRPAEQPGRWGWRQDRDYPAEWREQGACVGYVDGDDVYLLPDAALTAMTRLSQQEPLSLNKTTLAKRLNERSVLIASELSTRGTLTVRKQINGRRQVTWHLKAHHLGAGLP